MSRGTIMKGRAAALDGNALSAEVAGLSKAGVKDLRERWKRLYGSEASGHIGRSILIGATAYRLQERALGGLKPSAQRILDRVCYGREEIGQEGIAKRRVSPGTVLIREWQGVRHRVVVLDNDVTYRGRRYKSLSEVARAITGARWSGPLFFGLKGRAKEVANG